MFRLLLISFLALAATSASLATEDRADALVRDGYAAEERLNPRAALQLFLQADAARPNDAAVLQQISKQYSDSSEDVADATERKRLCTAALVFARRAAALQPKNPANLLSIAICYGKLALLDDNRARIEDAREMKNFAEQALALSPNYALAHHILGRWHYEVASQGGTKLFLANLLYGGLPPASTAEAVRHLRRAVELEPESPAHPAELGFALLADGQPAQARAAFEKALTLPAHEIHDAVDQRRAREELAKLRK